MVRGFMVALRKAYGSLWKVRIFDRVSVSAFQVLTQKRPFSKLFKRVQRKTFPFVQNFLDIGSWRFSGCWRLELDVFHYQPLTSASLDVSQIYATHALAA